MMGECFEIALDAVFDEGHIIISRQDGKPISIITHEEVETECVEVLEYGDSGNAVKAMQCLLNCHGQHLETDGIFGNLTQTALIIFQDSANFQDSAKLNANGVCDSLTWSALIGR